MYDAIDDKYCYPKTNILKNKANIRDRHKLDEFEHAMFTLRASEDIVLSAINIKNYCKLHRHLFQDVYNWAWKVRTVRIAKNGSMFCYPEYIESELIKILTNAEIIDYNSISREEFIDYATEFLANLNAIHPFREENGRTQNIFFALLVNYAGYIFDIENINAENFLQAMVDSFNGNNTNLHSQLNQLII